MKAYGFMSEQIQTSENWNYAEDCASRRKRRRKEVREFRADLDRNLSDLSSRYDLCQDHTFDYKFKTIQEKKERFLSMLEYPEHVFDWGILIPSEPILNRAIDGHSYACIKGRGQHMMLRNLAYKVKTNPKIQFVLTADVSKMYASIPLWLPKKNIRKKIKDPKLLFHFDQIIDSSIGTPMGNNNPDNPTGVPIGLKISTMIANMSLCYFGHDCRKLFGVGDDSILLDKMAGEYISRKFVSARTKDDLNELSKGVQYLSEKFKGYVRGGVDVYLFMDNVFIPHEDKTFLHMMVDWIGLYWASELHLTINPKWQVVNLNDGLPIVGYRLYADGHIRAGKESKQKGIRKIRRGRKMGLSNEQVRRACSSHLGTWVHADSKNLIRKYHMEKRERLGAKINRRKSLCPFEGMVHDQQRKFEAVLFDPETMTNEESRLMDLLDFAVIPSIKEMNDDGTPKPCLAIRYIWQGEPVEYEDDKGKMMRLEKGQEYFSYTGSKVLIEQTQTEFSKEDLPSPTVIKITINKRKKKFYKFT